MPRNIMIADDVKMNRVLLIDILDAKLKDAVFYEAQNGLEVLQIVNKVEIDLIILDLIMPVKDGYQVLKELKADPNTADIPVIVSSAISDIKSIEDTLRDGAIDYFTKPLTRQDMDIILPLKAKNALVLYEQKKTIEKLNDEINLEIKNANTFQNIILPKPRDFKSVEMFMKYHPCLGIGGDYFDCVEKNDKLWFMIADVTGHGIAAGMASSMVKVMFRSGIEAEGITPGELLENINKNVFELSEGTNKFNYLAFTAFVGCIEKDGFTYANAGQPYPILLKESDKSISMIDQNGLIIGIKEDARYDESTIKLEKGDCIWLYTDGLFSSGKSGDFKNWVLVEDFANLFKSVAFKDGTAFLEKAFNHFKLLHMKGDGIDYTDDVAMLFLRYK
jgi:phosphoserine phosphatase RsbU/P